MLEAGDVDTGFTSVNLVLREAMCPGSLGGLLGDLGTGKLPI